jgi:hypothetical protein
MAQIFEPDIELKVGKAGRETHSLLESIDPYCSCIDSDSNSMKSAPARLCTLFPKVPAADPGRWYGEQVMRPWHGSVWYGKMLQDTVVDSLQPLLGCTVAVGNLLDGSRGRLHYGCVPKVAWGGKWGVLVHRDKCTTVLEETDDPDILWRRPVCCCYIL